MLQPQTLIEILFTGFVLAIAGLAIIAYFALFYVVMIALDGCAVCKWLQQVVMPEALSHTQGQSLSRTKRALT